MIKLIKVDRKEPIMVLRVDKEKKNIDLSKRKVSKEDIQAYKERYNKSKFVHFIMCHIVETMNFPDGKDLRRWRQRFSL